MPSHDGSNSHFFYEDEYPFVARSTFARVRNAGEGFFKFPELDRLAEELEKWENEFERADYDPLPTVNVIVDLLESTQDAFLKMDPDPLDDRHPHRTHPHAAYGNLMKQLFKRTIDFINVVVISYFTKDNMDLKIAATRLLLACTPGTDADAMFGEPDFFIPKIFEYAKQTDNELLQAYSTSLLASAMEPPDHASKHRTLNAQFISIALKRLSELKDRMLRQREAEENGVGNGLETKPGPFFGIDVSSETPPTPPSRPVSETKNELTNFVINRGTDGERILPYIGLGGSLLPMRGPPPPPLILPESAGSRSPPRKKMKPAASFGSLQDLESSNSCWSKMQNYVIGNNQVYPLTVEMHQRFILQYLGQTGEYQDLLSLALEGNSMDLLFFFIDLENTRDVRVTFDALRYLTSLLVHRKFALEFVARGGIQQLLKVPRLSMASVGAITCFYYLSYNEEVMESVCQLDGKVLDELVSYVLWCIDHSYESGMASASMFLSHAVFFKAMLERIDRQDGFRLMFNYISTLGVSLDPATSDRMSEEMLTTSVQAIRNASHCFRNYFTAHLYVKLEHMKKSCKELSHFLKMPLETVAPHKMIHPSDEFVENGVEVLTAILKVSPSGWKAVEPARKFGLFKTLLTAVEYIRDWHTGIPRADTVRNSLDVIFICSALPKFREDLVNLVVFQDETFDGFGQLMAIVDGVWYLEERMQQHALKILVNCVQSYHLYKNCFRLDPKRNKLIFMDLSETDRVVIEGLRRHNVIFIMLRVIRRKIFAAESERAREWACRCLLGLCRDKHLKQVISMTPLLNTNELQLAMKTSVAHDKRIDHQRFCKAASALFDAVIDKSLYIRGFPDAKNVTQENLWRSYIVDKTRINYNETELLQLIHRHLTKTGLSSAAAALAKEADLPEMPTGVDQTPVKLQPLPCSLPSTAEAKERCSTPSFYANHQTPRRLTLPKTPISKRLLLRTPGSARTFSPVPKVNQPAVGLTDIMTDYFRQQHSNCLHPVTTCPPFSLFFPHHCPEPRTFGTVSSNIVRRFQERTIRKNCDLRKSIHYDEKHAFGVYRQARHYGDHEEMYTSITFSVDDEHLIVGMFNGDVYWINVETGNEDSHTVCHQSAVSAVEQARDGSMLLTTSSFMPPYCSLWTLRETQEHAYDFPYVIKVQFANLTQERIVATSEKKGVAKIFDTETGRAISNFTYSPDRHVLRYKHNIATFSPDDTLIHDDGVIWDVRDSIKPVFVLDKLNMSNGGRFHPHGHEIIINSEVWDMRTFRLLQMVPALEDTSVSFNSTGNIMFALTRAEEDMTTQFSSTFKTFDSRDYSIITSVEMKRNILGLACSNNDQHLSLIERHNTNDFLDADMSLVRLFEIGRRRDEEDDLDEVDENDDNRREEESDNESLVLSDDSLEGEDIGVFGALRNFGETTDSSLTDEEDEDDDGGSDSDDDGDSSDGDSDGWETASGEDLGGNDAAENGESSDSDSGESDDNDASFEPPEEEMEHPSTSTVALNPEIRRQKRRHDESGANH